MIKEFRSHKYQETVYWFDDDVRFDYSKQEWYAKGSGRLTGNDYRITLTQAPRENDLYVEKIELVPTDWSEIEGVWVSV